ncbi:hypothetical protein [Tunturiibacter gelidiferens]|uniref:hypothetical protein n=1 Tax=Tunturiibacter gelidiferens TaxID=3069689 RepID=UPI003D9B0939
MEESWAFLDATIEKTDLAFHVASHLAKADREQALGWLKKAEESRATHLVSTSSDAYRHCLLLACRGYAGLVKRRIDDVEDLRELGDRIKRIPSALESLSVWSDLALRILKLGRTEEARQIGTDYIQKLIAQFRPATTDRYRAIALAMPLLFNTTRATARELLSELPIYWKDIAIGQLVEFICKKLPPWEPYEASYQQAYRLTIDEITDLCELAEVAETDVVAYWIVSTICTSLKARGSRKVVTENQRADTIAKLKRIAANKFPNQYFIKHDGYKVMSDADIAQLSKYIRGTWEELLVKAFAIPNVADRCLVLTCIAGKIAKNDAEWAAEIFDKCETEAQTIPSALDRAGRFHTMAREVYPVDRDRATRFYKQALLLARDDANPEYEAVRKDIIDSAYQISPELATSLASATDEDEARRDKRGISSRMETLQLRRQLAATREDNDGLPEAAKTRLSQATWELLGSLNAGRIVPIRVQQTSSYIAHAAALPFRAAFPVYAYVVENAIERIQDKSEATRTIRGDYRAVSTAADLFYFLAERSTCGVPGERGYGAIETEESCFVDAGERERGISFIERWITTAPGPSLDISDPFLSPVDMVEILKMVLLANPALEVNIITSRRALLGGHVAIPFKDSFSKAWAEASSQNPPITRIIVVSVGADGDPLIHDRWWCSGSSSIDTGTSFNGIGIGKSSKITLMPAEQSAQASERMTASLKMGARFIEGRRVVYESFDLE